MTASASNAILLRFLMSLLPGKRHQSDEGPKNRWPGPALLESAGGLRESTRSYECKCTSGKTSLYRQWLPQAGIQMKQKISNPGTVPKVLASEGKEGKNLKESKRTSQEEPSLQVICSCLFSPIPVHFLQRPGHARNAVLTLPLSSPTPVNYGLIAPISSLHDL